MQLTLVGICAAAPRARSRMHAATGARVRARPAARERGCAAAAARPPLGARFGAPAPRPGRGSACAPRRAFTGGLSEAWRVSLEEEGVATEAEAAAVLQYADEKEESLLYSVRMDNNPTEAMASLRAAPRIGVCFMRLLGMPAHVALELAQLRRVHNHDDTYAALDLQLAAGRSYSSLPPLPPALLALSWEEVAARAVTLRFALPAALELPFVLTHTPELLLPTRGEPYIKALHALVDALPPPVLETALADTPALLRGLTTRRAARMRRLWQACPLAQLPAEELLTLASRWKSTCDKDDWERYMTGLRKPLRAAFYTWWTD